MCAVQALYAGKLAPPAPQRRVHKLVVRKQHLLQVRSCHLLNCQK